MIRRSPGPNYTEEHQIQDIQNNVKDPILRELEIKRAKLRWKHKQDKIPKSLDEFKHHMLHGLEMLPNLKSLNEHRKAIEIQETNEEMTELDRKIQERWDQINSKKTTNS